MSIAWLSAISLNYALANFREVKSAKQSYITIGYIDEGHSRHFRNLAVESARQGYDFWENHVNERFGSAGGFWIGGQPYMVNTVRQHLSEAHWVQNRHIAVPAEWWCDEVANNFTAQGVLAVIIADAKATDVDPLHKAFEAAGVNHIAGHVPSPLWFEKHAAVHLWGIAFDSSTSSLGFLTQASIKSRTKKVCILRDFGKRAEIFAQGTIDYCRGKMDLQVVLDEVLDSWENISGPLASFVAAMSNLNCDVFVDGIDGNFDSKSQGDTHIRAMQMIASANIPLIGIFTNWPTVEHSLLDELGVNADFIFTSATWHHTESYTCPTFGTTAKYVEGFKAWSLAEKGIATTPDFHSAISSAAGVVLQLAFNTSWFASGLPTSAIDVHENLRKAIGDTKEVIFSGNIRFNRYGHNIGREMTLLQVQNGTWNAVLPATGATHSMIMPMPTFQSRSGCPNGTFNTGTACSPCGAQRYNDVWNAKDCKWCPAGTYSVEGASACIKCPVGKSRFENSIDTCSACLNGTVAHAQGMSQCEKCDVGKYASKGVECVLCTQGTFTNVIGVSACDLCEPGKSKSSVGSVACKACPVGRFQDAAGQTDCVQCPESMTTLEHGRQLVSDCQCKANHFGPRATSRSSSCEPCPALRHSPLGSADRSSCTLSAAGGAVIAALILFVVGSLTVLVLWRRLMKRYAERLDAVLEQKLIAGLSCVKSLAFPMVLCSAPSLLQLDLDTARTLHEGCRNDGMLIFLDTLEILVHFKSLGKHILFFSYQWVSWDVSGPNQIQWLCMLQAVATIATSTAIRIEDLYVWLDILSIPQFNHSIKALAVNSLYTFAQQADIMLVVAPPTIHSNLQIICDVSTYKHRVWCRAEQFAFFCFHDVAAMLVTCAPGEVDKITDGWMHDMGCIFDGNMTCCTKKHPGGMPCDKQSLVNPLLALFFDLYTRMKSSMLDNITQGAWDFMSPQLDTVFPATADYVTETKQSADNVTKQILFSDMIMRVKLFVDKDLTRALNMQANLEARKGAHLHAVPCHDNSSVQLKVFRALSPKEIMEQRKSIEKHDHADEDIMAL